LNILIGMPWTSSPKLPLVHLPEVYSIYSLLSRGEVEPQILIWSFLARDAMLAWYMQSSCVCVCVCHTQVLYQQLNIGCSNGDDLVCVYFKVIYQFQSFSNRMIRSCKISIDKRVARSLCNSRASCLISFSEGPLVLVSSRNSKNVDIGKVDRPFTIFIHFNEICSNSSFFQGP